MYVKSLLRQRAEGGIEEGKFEGAPHGLNTPTRHPTRDSLWTGQVPDASIIYVICSSIRIPAAAPPMPTRAKIRAPQKPSGAACWATKDDISERSNLEPYVNIGKLHRTKPASRLLMRGSGSALGMYRAEPWLLRASASTAISYLHCFPARNIPAY